MALTLGSVLTSGGIDPAEAMVIRDAYVREHHDGAPGLQPESTDLDILRYTQVQSANPRSFPLTPPRIWVVFLPEGGDRARLWSVLRNHGEVTPPVGASAERTFDLEPCDHMSDMRRRLVIGWRSPRTWRVNATTAANYPVMEIADAEPVRFPGFDQLILSHSQLQAVIHDQRYASWRTALASVQGIYLITDTRDGRNYVGKADGADNILQRWSAYAANGHGGNVELRTLEPSTFRYSVLRVFDPTTPTATINAAESHYKNALVARRHGLNRS